MALGRLLLLVHLATVPLLVASDVIGKTLAPGDPRLCLVGQPDLWRFEVLPGMGWDNLRNVEGAVATSHTYSLCQTTDDGRFLLPDSVTTVPVKASKVQTFAELMTHWDNFTSTTATSVNVDTGGSFIGISISGKFSSDFLNAKSQMVGGSSITTRVQIRYVRYTAKLQPDSPLSPALRHRLSGIATYLQQNQTKQARYAAQLLVRDFGTHVITSVDAGAIITQTDQVDSSFMEKSGSDKTAILAAAGASFFGVFHLGVSVGYNTNTDTSNQYTQKRTASLIESQGGPALSVNMSLDAWAAAADKDLVAIDRHGDPLWYLVTPQSLPELSDYMLFQVRQKVKRAVNLYYRYNTYRGCTIPGKPNFSPAANMEDGTCGKTSTNLTLGGVFVSCTQTESEAGDLCWGIRHSNPKTGDYSCPTGYTEVELHSSPLQAYRSETKCSGWWLWKECHQISHWSRATRRSVWCVAQGEVPQSGGFLFGGLYTSRVVNPLTQGSNCPDLFHPINLESDLYVCLSDDYELAASHSVPFGGFFSCSIGNPLAMNTNDDSSLATYLQKSGPSSWPQQCPKGFSQHLAYVDEGCEILYCVLSGALTTPGLPAIRRPPFMDEPIPTAPVPAQTNGTAAQSAREQANATAADEHNMVADMYEMSSQTPMKSSAPGHLNTRDTAIVAAVSTLGCVAIVTAAILLRRRCVRRRKNGDVGPIVIGRETSHGAINPDKVLDMETLHGDNVP